MSSFGFKYKLFECLKNSLKKTVYQKHTLFSSKSFLVFGVSGTRFPIKQFPIKSFCFVGCDA